VNCELFETKGVSDRRQALARAVLSRREHHRRSAPSPEETFIIKKTLQLSVAALLAVVAIVTPVGANIVRGGILRFSVTDPGTLVVLGACLVIVGNWTRRTLFKQRRMS
jgi:hypothetical protein